MVSATDSSKDLLNTTAETNFSDAPDDTEAFSTRQFKPNITLHDLKSDPRFQNLEPMPPKNLAQLQCIKLNKAKNLPTKRALFSMAQLSNGREVFFYGGVLDREKRLNELYNLKPQKRMWQKIVPSVEKVIPAQNILGDVVLRDTTVHVASDAEGASVAQPTENADADKKKPAPAKKAAAAKKGATAKKDAAPAASAAYEGISLITYGHQGCNSLIKNMYEFDLNQKKWKLLAPSGDMPPPSHGHTLLYYKPEDAIILFGGSSFEGIQTAFNSVYMCLVSGPPQPKQKKKPKKKKKITYFWQQVHFQDDDLQPEARYGHVAQWLDQYNMIIHGGTNGEKNFDDVWMFNVPTRKWIPVETTAESDEHRPTGGRYHHAACMIGRTLWISFGVPFNSEVYSLEIPENLTASTADDGSLPSQPQPNAQKAVWSRYVLAGETLPSRRWGHNMIVHSKGTKEQLPSFMIVFGCGIVGKYHSDCWMITDPKSQVQVGNDDE